MLEWSCDVYVPSQTCPGATIPIWDSGPLLSPAATWWLMVSSGAREDSGV